MTFSGAAEQGRAVMGDAVGELLEFEAMMERG
jgi:hypothetical protein